MQHSFEDVDFPCEGGHSIRFSLTNCSEGPFGFLVESLGARLTEGCETQTSILAGSVVQVPQRRLRGKDSSMQACRTY